MKRILIILSSLLIWTDRWSSFAQLPQPVRKLHIIIGAHPDHRYTGVLVLDAA